MTTDKRAFWDALADIGQDYKADLPIFDIRPHHPEIEGFDVDEPNGGACPQQFNGWLNNGEYFYFRYRHGIASLRTWDEDDEEQDIIYPKRFAHLPHGDEWDGCLSSQQELNEVFSELYNVVMSVR